MCQTVFGGLLFIVLFWYIADITADGPEINDQYVTKNDTTVEVAKSAPTRKLIDWKSNSTLPEQDGDLVLPKSAEATQNDAETAINSALRPQNSNASHNQVALPQRGVLERLYLGICGSVNSLLEIPKVTYVVKNVGTCMVNGFMEIVSYYLPPPLIPLVASLAGMFIPFEPVVQLKRRNPVESYRRALSSAMDSFMGTFNQNGGLEDDPYMTRRFNSKYGGENAEQEPYKRLLRKKY